MFVHLEIVNDFQLWKEFSETAAEKLNEIEKKPSVSAKLVAELDKETTLWLLHLTACSKKVRIVECIERVGANVNTLELAFAKGDVKLVDSLMHKGEKFGDVSADLMARLLLDDDKMGTRKSMLEVLIRHATDLKGMKISGGRNLLHLFIRCYAGNLDAPDQVDITRLLLSAGISLKERADNNRTPIEEAFMLKNEVLIYFFSSLAEVSEGDMKNLMNLAFEYDCDANVIKYFISMGVDVNAANSYGDTALHVACKKHDDALISFLIRQGGDLNVRNAFDETPQDFLNLRHQKYDECYMAIVKGVANLAFKNDTVSYTSCDIFQDYEIRMRKRELELLSNTKFYGPHSYYSILSESINAKKLSTLMMNKELVTKFTDDLLKFSYYKEDLKIILEKALELRDESLAVQSRLKSIFGDFFPGLVIKKLNSYLTLNDLPLEQNQIL